jgi:hypothetical protein
LEIESMAHLWTRDQSTAESAWAVEPLAGDAVALGGSPGAAALLLRRRDYVPESWVLLASSAIAVNGIPLLTGMRVLRNRDELRAADVHVFFATERLARVEPFPGTDQAIYCARCKDIIAPQSDAVRCPACHVWHHQSQDMPCWTYSATCALCDQPTDLDAAYRWTPEEL